MNYSNRRTKLETPGYYFFLFIFIPRVSLCRLVLASAFLLAFGAVQSTGTNDGGRRVVEGSERDTVRLNHKSVRTAARTWKEPAGFANFEIAFREKHWLNLRATCTPAVKKKNVFTTVEPALKSIRVFPLNPLS